MGCYETSGKVPATYEPVGSEICKGYRKIYIGMRDPKPSVLSIFLSKEELKKCKKVVKEFAKRAVDSSFSVDATVVKFTIAWFSEDKSFMVMLEEKEDDINSRFAFCHINKEQMQNLLAGKELK